MFQNRRQRENAMLQHRREGHDARARPAQSVIDGMIVGGVSRSRRRASVPSASADVEPEAHFAQMRLAASAVTHAVEFQRPELRLRVGQNVLHRRKLHRFRG